MVGRGAAQWVPPARLQPTSPAESAQARRVRAGSWPNHALSWAKTKGNGTIFLHFPIVPTRGRSQRWWEQGGRRRGSWPVPHRISPPQHSTSIHTQGEPLSVVTHSSLQRCTNSSAGTMVHTLPSTKTHTPDTFFLAPHSVAPAGKHTHRSLLPGEPNPSLHLLSATWCWRGEDPTQNLPPRANQTGGRGLGLPGLRESWSAGPARAERRHSQAGMKSLLRRGTWSEDNPRSALPCCRSSLIAKVA